MATDTNDTGPSLFEDLVAGLGALDDRATMCVTVDVAGEHRQLVMPADGARCHAELRSDAGALACRDAGSSYGTWVDREGQRIEVPVELTAGDRIVTAGDAVLLTVIEI